VRLTWGVGQPHSVVWVKLNPEKGYSHTKKTESLKGCGGQCLAGKGIEGENRPAGKIMVANKKRRRVQ